MANIGDRIRLILMPDEPNPIPHGTTGTIKGITDVSFMGFTQYTVEWDGPYSLMLASPPDVFEVIEDEG